jgi:hypothetical protein
MGNAGPRIGPSLIHSSLDCPAFHLFDIQRNSAHDNANLHRINIGMPVGFVYPLSP